MQLLDSSFSAHGSGRRSIGYHELFCNGVRQGVPGAKLQPGYTNFEKRTYYIVYDLSDCLKAGNNSLGILLGNGWFSTGSENHSSPYATTLPGSRPVPPQMLLRARATVNDNSAVFISSSRSGKWTAADGPIVTDSLYNGEVYDARKELIDRDGRHFSHPLYDTEGADWAPAARMNWIPDAAQLVPQTMPPIRMIRKLSASSIRSPSPGIWIIDFRQNSAAIIRFRVPRMASGSNITIVHGEVLLNDNTSLKGKSPLFSANKSGRVYTDNLRTAQATDVYLLCSASLDCAEQSLCAFRVVPRNTYITDFRGQVYQQWKRITRSHLGTNIYPAWVQVHRGAWLPRQTIIECLRELGDAHCCC